MSERDFVVQRIFHPLTEQANLRGASMTLLILKMREGYVRADDVKGSYSLTLIREEATWFSETAYYDFLGRHPEIASCQPLKADNREDTRFIKMP